MSDVWVVKKMAEMLVGLPILMALSDHPVTHYSCSRGRPVFSNTGYDPELYPNTTSILMLQHGFQLSPFSLSSTIRRSFTSIGISYAMPRLLIYVPLVYCSLVLLSIFHELHQMFYGANHDLLCMSLRRRT